MRLPKCIGFTGSAVRTAVSAAIIAVASAVFSCPVSRAGVVEDFADRLAHSRVAFTYAYETSGSVAFTGSAWVEFQGECFAMTGDGLEIRCNGAVRWTLDRGAGECYVENVTQGDLFSNPAAFLMSMSKGFVSVRESRSNFGGVATMAVAMIPEASGTGLAQAVVHFDAGVPVGAEISLEDGSVMVLSISDMTFAPASEDLGDFMVDTGALPAGYVVVDLRD